MHLPHQPDSGYTNSAGNAFAPLDTEDTSDASETSIFLTKEVAIGEVTTGISSKVRAWLLDIYMALLIVATFVADQVSKGLVRDHMVPGDSVPEEGLFRITHAYNTGSIFGLFPNQTILLMLASGIGICILLIFYRKLPIPGIWLRTSLGLQLGGATGNLVDRITRGRVTDFIDIGVWPIFNLADSSILVGIAVLAWFLLRSPKETPQTEEPSLNNEPLDAPG